MNRSIESLSVLFFLNNFFGMNHYFFLHSLWLFCPVTAHLKFSTYASSHLSLENTRPLKFDFIPLLNPFSNHRLSLQFDWLSTVPFYIHKIFALKGIIFSANENETVNQNSSSCI